MPICFICSKNLPSIKSFSYHFSLIHANMSIDQYKCCEDNCNRYFSLFNSFKKHLKSHYESKSDCSVDNYDTTDCNVNKTNPFNELANISFFEQQTFPNISNSKLENVNELTTTNVDFKTRLAKFCSNLYAKPQIPRNFVQVVVKELNTLFVDGLDSSSNILIANGEMPPEGKSSVNLVAKVIDKSIESLNSEHKRLLFFEKSGTYIPPIELAIGETLHNVRKDNVSTLVPMPSTQQIIPLRRVLKKFLQTKNVMEDLTMFLNDNKVKVNCISNFIEGSVWQRKILSQNGQFVLPLFIYFDDFEVGNPLGSHSGFHKLGALYTSIPCLPTHYTSLLRNIFLTLLFHSQDRCNFGNNVIFTPIIEELNYLREIGIEITTGSFSGTVRFELGLLVGDNLGLHSINGFVESFSANFPCRFCRITKDNLKFQCVVDASVMRTKECYAEDMIDGLVSNCGVKEPSVWHNVIGFHVIDQLGVDAMHDLLEGVCKYDMLFIISYYVLTVKYFSIEVLNDRISNFDYGPDSSSKPVQVTLDNIKKNNLRQSASEMLVLTRYFGLLVGDMVPENDQVWRLYILLKEILDLLMSPVVQRDSCTLLKTLITEHHQLYIRYSGSHLKPKYHFMLHYPDLIEKFGPLVNIWSMRYEAKHRISKVAASVNSSRRNICKSIAIRHQLQLNHLFTEESFSQVLIYGPSQLVEPSRMEMIKNTIRTHTDSIVKVPWVQVKGTKYQMNSVLTLTVTENDLPIFGSVKDLFVINDSLVVLQCVKYRTVCYEEHVGCYEVEIKEYMDSMFVKCHELPSHVPNNISLVSNGLRYVCVRGGL